MGIAKHPHDWDRYDKLFAISRSAQELNVPFPDDGEEIQTARELIEYVAQQRGVSPESPIEILVKPTSEEKRREAFRRLKAGLESIGGIVPEHDWSTTALDDLVPHRDRKAKWEQLSDELECDLPGLDTPGWALWFCLFLTYPFVVMFVMLLMLVVLLPFALAGFNPDPPWVIKTIMGTIIYVGTLWLGAMVAVRFESLVFRRPSRIPFDSIDTFTSHIVSNHKGIEECLKRSLATTIRKHVHKIVAEVYSLSPEEVHDDFQLCREASLNQAG